MINVRTMRKLANNDGLTLKDGRIVSYKSGYQVADYGMEAATPEAAMQAVKLYKGSCGIWYSEGTYYIDHSFRVSTKAEALRVGRENKQISVFKWSTKELVYC